MSATVPNVGVRVFSDLTPTIASIDARQTYAYMCLPAPNADAQIEVDRPTVIPTSDPEKVALLGDGVAKDAIAQIAAEGITTDVIFSRAAEGADEAAQLGHIAGNAANKTGVWSALEALSETGLEPGLIIAPGYTSQRPGNAANPVLTAADAVCDRIIDCMAIGDAGGATREAAQTAAADFANLAQYHDGLSRRPDLERRGGRHRAHVHILGGRDPAA